MKYLFINDEIPPLNREEQDLFFRNLYGNQNPLVVEIGSGNGHYLVGEALKNPQLNYAGTEILGGRARKFHAKIEKRNLGNIAVFKGDARRFVWEWLYENSTGSFVVMFPDPWPKKKHHKNRILTRAFLRMLFVRLVPGGLLTITTDDEPYRDWILEEIRTAGVFENLDEDGYSMSREEVPRSIFEEKFRREKKRISVIRCLKPGDS